MLNFLDSLNKYEEVGYVSSTSMPVVYVKGLPSVSPNEVVIFENNAFGQVMALLDDRVEVLLFSNESVVLDSRVARTNKKLSVPVSNALLGKTINPLGHSLVQSRPVVHEQENFYYIDAPALGIATRKKIQKPILSGVPVVDLMVPLGKGQRELILGDRKSGKTSFALQILVNNAKKGAICVYACIGKKKYDIRFVEAFMKDHGVYDNCVLIASAANDPLGLISITPYAAMSIAEYFRDQGREVVLFLDDLTTHAKFYREIALLAKRFPGRNSYPGDIFYAHSRLLERAGYFMDDTSITCFPIAATVEGDISGYIQTNLMSMTDGHIFFDSDLFNSGQRPAINQGYSVTRVGRQTQDPLRWSINRELTSFLALYRRTQNFVHFGAELNEGIKATLDLGAKMMQFFNQDANTILDLDLQIFLVIVLWSGVWNKKSTDELDESIKRVILKYDGDVEFKNKVNALISSSKDMNELLGNLMKDMTYYSSITY